MTPQAPVESLLIWIFPQKGPHLIGTRCREYTTRKGFDVVETIYEKAVSGGSSVWPSFNVIREYIRKSKIEGVVVIIDDISRFARKWALRRALKETGGTLESPSITFGEDSDSILIENLLACMSQHQRQKNCEKPKNTASCWRVMSQWPRSFRKPWEVLPRAVSKPTVKLNAF